MAGHFADERVTVLATVIVDLAQAVVYPDVAGAGVVADGLRICIGQGAG